MIQRIQQMVNTKIPNQNMATAIIILSILLVGIMGVLIVKRVILQTLKRLTQKTTTSFDDFLVHTLEKTFDPIAYYAVFYFASRWVTLDPVVCKLINSGWLIIITVTIIRFIVAIINYLLEELWLKGEENKEAKKKSLGGILMMTKCLLWSLGLIFLMDNLGFKVSSVLAGLGVGGVAVALAAQAILGDLFSYLSIFFDKPFEIGDFIINGDYMGTVEHVGVKTTRLRSLGGEQLVFANSDLTNSRVRNYKRMTERRVVFKLGLTYATPVAKLRTIPQTIKSIIESVEKTRFDRAHFSSYGDFNLVIEVVYYVLSNDYNIYMDLQQEINLAIKEAFEKQEIEFAYPTQTIYVNSAHCQLPLANL